MALNAVFDTQLSRIRLTGTSLTGASTAVFERSANNVTWTTIRGGSAVVIDGSDEATLDDYEFVPGAVNYYRVTAGVSVFTTTNTPAQSGVWFKSITRPFLNRAVNVIGYSDITRPARNGVFEVVGRSFPVAVTDLRLSRRFTLQAQTLNVADADALETMLASGDPLYVQTDGVNDIPGGYVIVNDINRSRYGTLSNKRYFDLPMVEVAAPGPDVVGSTSTWDTLVAEFGTWADVLAFFGTWEDVADYVADPSVIYVP